MKRILTLTLAAVLAVSPLASCASDTLLTSSASTASGLADEAWLESRLGEVPDGVTVGTAEELGLDMTDFEDDGYFIRTEDGETVVAGKTADGLDRAVRLYAKRAKDNAPVCDVTYHEGARIEKLTIAGRDISEYTVLYTHTVTPRLDTWGVSAGNGEFAATEFVRLIKEATGVVLPMSETPADGPTVSIEAVTTDEFPETGYSYEVKDGNVVFRGSEIARGCSNGVYTFVERELGWLGLVSYGDTYLAEAEHIDVPEGTKRSGELLFSHFYEAHCDGEPLKGAGNHNYMGVTVHACHGMHNYGFAGGIVDTRVEQPCYTDEYQYEIICECVTDYIESELSSGAILGETLTSIDVSQGDNRVFCKCKTCRSLVKDEGSESGPVVLFANRLAEEIDSSYPGMKYHIFAYEDTKKPPKTARTNDLVYVTFCMDGMCYNHSLDSGECAEPTFKSGGGTNDTYADYLRTWGSMDGGLYVWYYGMDGAFNQYDPVDNIYKDMIFLRSIGVTGFYLEGEHYGLGVGRLMHEMCSTLEFYPDMTLDEYRAYADERIRLEYGEDAVPIYREAQRIIRESACRVGCQTCWYTADFRTDSADYAYLGENLEYVNALLDEMIEDAPSCAAERRGKRLSLALLYEGVYGRYVSEENADGALTARLEELYGIFAERAVECGFNMNDFPLGLLSRKVGTTLAEEIGYWNTDTGKYFYH